MVDWTDILLAWLTQGNFLLQAFNVLSSMSEIGAELAQQSIVDFSFLIEIVYLLVYPLIWAVVIMQGVVTTIFGPLINLFNSILMGGNSLFSVVTVFQGVFPTPWIVGLTSILSLVVALRVYSMIPGIGKK